MTENLPDNIVFTVTMVSRTNRTGSMTLTYDEPDASDYPNWTSLKVYKNGSLAVTLTDEETWLDASWSEEDYYQLGSVDSVEGETLSDLLPFPYDPVYPPESAYYADVTTQLWGDQSLDTLIPARLLKYKIRHECEIERQAPDGRLTDAVQTNASILIESHFHTDTTPLLHIEIESTPIEQGINTADDEQAHTVAIHVIDDTQDLTTSLLLLETLLQNLSRVIRDKYEWDLVVGAYDSQGEVISWPVPTDIAEQRNTYAIRGAIRFTVLVRRSRT